MPEDHDRLRASLARSFALASSDDLEAWRIAGELVVEPFSVEMVGERAVPAGPRELAAPCTEKGDEQGAHEQRHGTT